MKIKIKRPVNDTAFEMSFDGEFKYLTIDLDIPELKRAGKTEYILGRVGDFLVIYNQKGECVKRLKTKSSFDKFTYEKCVFWNERYERVAQEFFASVANTPRKSKHKIGNQKF